jgi:hypothetical protein
MVERDYNLHRLILLIPVPVPCQWRASAELMCSASHGRKVPVLCRGTMHMYFVQWTRALPLPGLGARAPALRPARESSYA